MHVERRTNLMHVKRHANLMYRELHLFMHVKRRRCRRVGVVKRRSNAVMHLDNQGAESLSHEILRRRVGGVLAPDSALACITAPLFYNPALLACIMRLFTCLHYYAGEWEEWGNPNERKYFEYMLQYRCVWFSSS